MQKGTRVNVTTPDGKRQVAMVVKVDGTLVTVRFAGGKELTYSKEYVKVV